jgi:hypothetical protein
MQRFERGRKSLQTVCGSDAKVCPTMTEVS